MLSYNALFATILGASLLASAPGMHAASGGSVYEQREIYAERERAKRARAAKREAGIAGAEKYYLGVDIGRFGADQSPFSSGAHGTVLFGQLGMDVNDDLSVELRGGFSMKGVSTASDADRVVDRDFDEVSANPDAYLDLFWGVYVRNNLSQFLADTANPRFEPYLVLGITYATISAVSEATTTLAGVSSTATNLDTVGFATISYGLGATFSMNNNVSYDIEFMRYVNKNGFAVNGLTLGMNWTLEFRER